MIAGPETLFGLRTGYPRDEADALVDFFTLAWRTQTGRFPADLTADLGELERFFNPIAQGARLRTEVANLAPLAKSPPPLPEEVFIRLDGRRGLLTPEGRVALECFELVLAQSATDVVFDTTVVAWANWIVADTYRTWSRPRLLNVVRPKTALQVPVTGFVLVLLVNGCIGPNRALPLGDDALEAQLSALIREVVDAFADVLRPGRRRLEEFRLRGGWTLTEATRHLFGSVINREKRVWVDEGAADDLPLRLGHELARHRGLSRPQIEIALDALVERYHRVRPQLVSLGLAFERPARTAAIGKAVVAGFDEARKE